MVNNKIYVIGGYYVEDNFSEESSDDVHVFNPETNQWEEDAALIPVPIDDHVQAVWNNSLIYIVTGWSDTGNVPDVQIYNPSSDVWLEGTATPNTSDYKVFGGSGDIIGNRIIYHGGVRGGFGFFPTAEVRVGTINPLSPNLIEWELMGESEQGNTYRAAALAIPSANSVFWIGGSSLGYNFDGIDYNGTGGVDPSDKITGFNGFTSAVTYEAQVIHEDFNVLPMDLRGIARVTNIQEEEETGVHQSIICGGIDVGQAVSDQVFLITGDDIVSVEEEFSEAALQWSINSNSLTVNVSSLPLEMNIYSVDGKLVLQRYAGKTINIEALSKGVYILGLVLQNGKTSSVKFTTE